MAMQVTETSARAQARYKVVVSAARPRRQLESARGDEGQGQDQRLPPGKVPTATSASSRQVHHGEVVQEAVNGPTARSSRTDKSASPARPKLDIVGGQAEMEQVAGSKGDLAFTVAVETLPVSRSGVRRRRHRTYASYVPRATSTRPSIAWPTSSAPSTTRKATRRPSPTATGRRSISSARSTARHSRAVGEGIDLVVGSKSFIPGFEEQLVGLKKGERRPFDTIPGGLRRVPPRRQGRDLRRDREGRRRPGEAGDRRGIRQEFGFETLEAFRRRHSLNIEADMARGARIARQARPARRARRPLFLRTAAGPGRSEFDGISRSIVDSRPSAARPSRAKARPRRRRARSIAGSPSAACASVSCWPRSRKAGVKVSDDELTQGPDRARPRLPGPGESRSWNYYRRTRRRSARSARRVRGKGDRRYPRPGQGHRQARDPRGTGQDGRGEGRGLIPSLRNPATPRIAGRFSSAAPFSSVAGARP